MSAVTRGPQRRLLCNHTPTGTVAWPDTYVRGNGAAVYSCDRPACVQDAAEWVREQTGHLGVYRPFPPGSQP